MVIVASGEGAMTREPLRAAVDVRWSFLQRAAASQGPALSAFRLLGRGVF